MSNEIKAVSFRLIEEDIQKFREIADEQGLNQAEMFQGLMNSFEMAKAKGMITDRAKEIEVFQDTVNNLVSMFINSLAINQTSEERIRETLSLELNTKDKTIADLQEYKEKTKDQLKTNKEEIKTLEDVGNDLRYTLDKTNKELDQKTSIVDNQQDQINTLNSIVTEYKQYKDINKDLEVKNNELNTKVTDVLHSNADLESKIENLESMKNFYKSEVDSLKNEIKELNTNIKLIEQASKEEIKATEKAYKDELKALEEEHRMEISSLKKELADKFNEELADKLEVEKSKYELKLDKAINKEQLLRINYDNLKAQYDKDIVKNKK
jgi:chromosome segregation ATPase